MTENEKQHQIGNGLPRCIGNGTDGYERLNSKLGLPNRHHRKALLESESAKERTRNVRKALSKRRLRLRPGERDRSLLFALYGDPSFRRDLWESAYDGTRIRENESQEKIHLIPSLEHRILSNYIQDGYCGKDGLSEIDRVFAEWPDLVQHLKGDVPWGGLAAHAWSDMRKNLDAWADLSDEQRRQTTLLAFAAATIVDDERILRAAIRKVPGLETEFGDVLGNGDDSEATDSFEEEDVLLRWNELCKSLQTLAAKAAGSTPAPDALTEITHIVGELEEIEQSVRERLALPSFEYLMSHLHGFLGELEADQAFSWLEDKVRAQLHARWRGVEQSLSPVQMGEEIGRLDAGVPIAVGHVRELAVALSDATHRLDVMRTEEPTDFASRLPWEDALERQEDHIRALRGEQRQAWIVLLSQLSPLGKEFNPSQNYSNSPPVQASTRDTDERLGSAVPEMVSPPDVYAPESVERSTVSTASATDEAQPTEQAGEVEISDAPPAATGEVDPIGAESTPMTPEDQHTKGSDDSEFKPTEFITPPPLPATEHPESKGSTAADSRSVLALTRMSEALLESPPRIAYSVQVGRLIDRLGLTTNQPPIVLFEAALLSDRLRFPDAAIAAELSRILENFPPPKQFADSLSRDVYVMLALAGTLRPALLAPQSGALAFLTTLKPSERLGAVYLLAQAVAEECQKLQGVRIDSTILRGVGSEVVWEDARERLNQEAAEWYTQALHKTIKYAAATNVWQKWLKSGELIGQMMTLITGGGSDGDTLIEEIVAKLEDRRKFEEQVKKTDRVEIGRRRGQDIHAGALNRLHAHAQEAVEFAHRHLSLNSSRPSQSDFLIRALANLREQVERLAPPALQELRGCTGERSLFAGAANIAVHAIGRFREFLHPEETNSDREPDPRELVASGLFGFSTLHISDDGTPDDDYLLALDTLLHTGRPEGIQSAFEQRLVTGDLGTAQRIVDWIEQEDIQDVDEYRSRLENALWSEITRLRHEMDATRIRVEIALVRGYISDAARDIYEADLVGLERRLAESRVLRFNVERAKLRRMESEIEHGLMAQRCKVEDALTELSLAPDDLEGKKVQQALREGDLVTANELIDRIRRKEHPSVEGGSSEQRLVFQEFYPIRSRAIDEALEDSRSSRRVVERIDEDGEFAGMPLGSIPGAQRRSARQMLEAWFTLKRAGRLDDRSKAGITTILTGLGFIVRKVTVVRSERGFGEVRVETDPLRARERCPIPAFGSFVNGQYRLVFLWGRPTEEDIFQHADERSGRHATIVFYLGRLSEARREAISHLARQRSRTLLVLDELLLIFLCGERGSRMPIFFACAIPFTYVQPYVTTAGLVPPEMFYGREQEMLEIANPHGSVFIYGGRQLGKTALLRAVERISHRPKEGSYAVWMDLKGEGIGYDRGAASVWPIIWRVLRDISAIPDNIKEPNPNIQGRVEDFLDYLCSRFDDSSRHTLLLLLDEADRFLEVDARDPGTSAKGYRESSRLKALMDRTGRSIKVVFAGLHNVLRTVEGSNHPLGHFGQAIQVGPLLLDGGWRTAEALIRQPLLASGYRFKHDSLVTRILAQTNYYPSLIQLYGSALVKAMCSRQITGAPLYDIDEIVLDETYQSTNLREMIRSRFHLTLQLDPRYEVIAYSIANECVEQEDLLGKGIDRRRVDEAVRDWWPEGFRDIEPYTDGFRSLLDEMVGLGVLRTVSEQEGRYTLRNSNVLLFMGTKDEIADNLLRSREPPQVFERELFRARHPQKSDGPSRSPLTLQQEDLLRAERNGVSLVCGLVASGFDDVLPFLRARGTSDAIVELRDLIDYHKFESELKRLHPQRQAGTTIYVIPDTVPWSEMWVQVALDQVRTLRAKGRYMQIMFMADPGHLWQLQSELKELNRAGLQWISLRPWRRGFLRQWMADAGFGDDPDVCDRIIEQTGGWKVLLGRLHALEQETGNLEVSLETLEKEFGDEKILQQLQCFGLDNLDIQNTLRCLAHFGEATFEELEAFVDDYGIDGDSLRRGLEWGELLHLVLRVGRGAWRMDSVAARVLHRADG